MNQILYEWRCRCKETLLVTKKSEKKKRQVEKIYRYPNPDLDEVFFSPLAEQAEDAAWFVCSPSGAERSSVSDVETSRQRLQAPSAGDVATSLMWCAPLLYTMHPSSALVQYRVVTLHGLRSARMPN